MKSNDDKNDDIWKNDRNDFRELEIRKNESFLNDDIWKNDENDSRKFEIKKNESFLWSIFDWYVIEILKISRVYAWKWQDRRFVLKFRINFIFARYIFISYKNVARLSVAIDEDLFEKLFERMWWVKVEFEYHECVVCNFAINWMLYWDQLIMLITFSDKSAVCKTVKTAFSL